MKPMLLFLLACGAASAALAQAAQGKDKEVTLTGTLHGGRVAIGGESTGWSLDYRDESGAHSVEVVLPQNLTARAKSGSTVRLTGTFGTREYVERGTVRVFRVTSLAMTKDSGEPGASHGTTPPPSTLPKR